MGCESPPKTSSLGLLTESKSIRRSHGTSCDPRPSGGGARRVTHLRQDGASRAADVVLGRAPVAHRDPHSGLAFPFGAAHPARSLALDGIDDLVGDVRVVGSEAD